MRERQRLASTTALSVAVSFALAVFRVGCSCLRLSSLPLLLQTRPCAPCTFIEPPPPAPQGTACLSWFLSWLIPFTFRALLVSVGGRNYVRPPTCHVPCAIFAFFFTFCEFPLYISFFCDILLSSNKGGVLFWVLLFMVFSSLSPLFLAKTVLSLTPSLSQLVLMRIRFSLTVMFSLPFPAVRSVTRSPSLLGPT